MEFHNYKTIKSKLKKRGLLFKKPNLEDAANQFYSLARQLDDYKIYSGFCHLAITGCQNRPSDQVGALLNAARAFSQAKHEMISSEDHIGVVSWIYTEALLVCDRSYIRPICLEMGRFYESNKMYSQAAESFKRSMSISRCVYNLLLAKRYKSALDELKNCPSHLMSTRDHTSMFLLELLLNENSEEMSRNSLQHLLSNSYTTTKHGLLPADDHVFDLTGLLESLLILRQDERSSKQAGESAKDNKIMNMVVDKLSAFLDTAQIQLLYHIVSGDE